MRQLGIYKAPDGVEFVASKGPDGMYFLFDLHHWINYGAVGLRVNEDGSVSRKGERTGMHVDDFEDTGRTARSAFGLHAIS